MREAIRRPSRGRRAGLSFKACLSFLQAFLDQGLHSEVLVLSPSIILPRRAAHSAGPTPKMRNFRPLGASWLKKWCSKRLSKNDQILIPFRYWILTLSAPFWDAKMAPKSIQNRSKLGSRPIRVSASIFTSILIDFASENGPPEPIRSCSRCSESTIFQKSAFQVDIDFWCDFPPNLAPLWRPKLRFF